MAPWTGGNPLIRQRNVFPATFDQNQFTAKLDYQIAESNRLSGTFFFANFPGFDPFPDPSSLASPVTLRRNDRNRTFALSDIHTFSPTLINEARVGFFYLNNTRSLTDEFSAITNAQIGIPNPALFFDDSNATRRLGHYIFRNNLSNLSFGGPNDSYNRRKQQTFSLADNVTYTRSANTFRFGGEYKRHVYDSNLPEEQASEFEKWENFTQFLTGLATEGDTQFGVTDKSFRMNDLSAYLAADLKAGKRLTFNVGVRWDWFSWPEEQIGQIGNFDFAKLTNPENPVAQFLVPDNVKPTLYNGIDSAIATSAKAGNNHTLKGQDLNNIAPRFGFAFSPFDNNKLVIRGGYGFFFDRPSAAFILVSAVRASAARSINCVGRLQISLKVISILRCSVRRRASPGVIHPTLDLEVSGAMFCVGRIRSVSTSALPRTRCSPRDSDWSSVGISSTSSIR